MWFTVSVQLVLRGAPVALPELSGRPRLRLIAQVRREQPNCRWCGYAIDLTLDAKTHPMGSTVDEWVPRSKSADPYRAAHTLSNLAHMHRRCNSAKGNDLVTETRTSRVW